MRTAILLAQAQMNSHTPANEEHFTRTTDGLQEDMGYLCVDSSALPYSSGWGLFCFACHTLLSFEHAYCTFSCTPLFFKFPKVGFALDA